MMIIHPDVCWEYWNNVFFHHSVWISSVCYAGFTLYVSDLYLWSVYDGYQVLIVWWRAKSPLDISKHTINYSVFVITSWVSLWDSLVTNSQTWKPQQPGCSHKQWWNKRFVFSQFGIIQLAIFPVSIRGYLWGFREQVMYRWRWLFSWCSTVARLNGRKHPKMLLGFRNWKTDNLWCFSVSH